MKVTRIIAAAIMTAAMAGTAHAQTNTANCTGGTPSASPCRVTNEVQATIPWVARMEIAQTTSLPSPLAEDFGSTAGKSTTSPTVLTVRSNAGVTVSAQAAAATWTGPFAKPAADLRLIVPGNTNAQPLNASVQVFQSAAATAATNLNLNYNVLYSWGTDVPGNYSLVVNYTLTSP